VDEQLLVAKLNKLVSVHSLAGTLLFGYPTNFSVGDP